MANQNEKHLDIVITREPEAIPVEGDNSNLSRHDFPDGFLFGTGTSAYQVEGAAAVGGKGLSTWDDITSRTPYRIVDGSNGIVAADMYYRFKEDIRTMKAMGLDAYRFSISWPRILPGGRPSAGINRKAIDYYNELIDTVIAHGMKPCVTIFHWDLPHILEEEYQGFLSKQIVEDFRDYAELCFWEFGDRVKWWTTINEPWTYSVNGYVKGTFPPCKVACPPNRVLKALPGHRSIQHPDATVPITRSYSDIKYDKSDPAKDAYTVTRNLLLAHSAAVNSYRTKFEVFQKGQIGIVLNSHWFVPLDENSPDDVAAAKRGVDFMLGWFLHPIMYGSYPQSMIDRVPHDNLASFTKTELKMLIGSVDYVGINYYTTYYAKNDPNPEGVGYDADEAVEFKNEKNGIRIGDPCGCTWLNIVPWGIYDHLVYLKNEYPNIPPIYITENGVADKSNCKLTAKQAAMDMVRTKYHQDHLANILKAIKQDQVDVRGYFIWSWCDNFEWTEGYTVRFGITYIDYVNHQTRYPKNSAVWLTKFLRGGPSIVPISKKRSIEEDAENVPEKRLKAL